MLVEPKDFLDGEKCKPFQFGASRETLIRGLLKTIKVLVEERMIIQGVECSGLVGVDDYTMYSLNIKYAEQDRGTEEHDKQLKEYRQTLKDLIGESGLLG